MPSGHSGERLFSVSRTHTPSCKHSPNGQSLGASSFDRRNSRFNKSQIRQRQPPLLLPGDAIAAMSSSSTSTATHNSNVIPIVVPRQGNSFWCQYPSESEFDTTRINGYLNAISLNRRNGGNGMGTSATKQMRSRSVEAPLNRLRMSLHKPVSSLISAISSPVGAKIIASNGSLSANANSSQSRAVLVTRSESLNSEGSSLSGESGVCELSSAIAGHHHHPGKSVLKKTSSTAAVHLNPGKKNVTFSAYATIQVMDG